MTLAATARAVGLANGFALGALWSALNWRRNSPAPGGRLADDPLDVVSDAFVVAPSGYARAQ